MQATQTTKVDVKTFAARYRSKTEIHRFLTVDVGAYLCPADCTTVFWLKDICSGLKKWIHCADIQYLAVPQYEGLSTQEILGFASAYPGVQDYLPSNHDIHKLPRQFVINVVYTRVGEPFAQWVRGVIDRRNQKICDDRDLLIELDAPIAAAFQRSTAVSTQKGNGCFQLKVGSKRPRAAVEMKGERDAFSLLKAENSRSAQTIEELQKSLAEAQQKIKSNEAAAEILTNMIQKGEAEMDQEGRVSVTSSKSKSELLI